MQKKKRKKRGQYVWQTPHSKAGDQSPYSFNFGKFPVDILILKDSTNLCLI